MYPCKNKELPNSAAPQLQPSTGTDKERTFAQLPQPQTRSRRVIIHEKDWSKKREDLEKLYSNFSPGFLRLLLGGHENQVGISHMTGQAGSEDLG